MTRPRPSITLDGAPGPLENRRPCVAAHSPGASPAQRDPRPDGCRQEQDHRRGDEARSEGAYDKAIKTYEKILAEDAKDVRILLKIGELHQKKGDEKAAAAAFQKVAETYAEQGFFLKSVAVYKQIVKLDPDDLRANERLAGLYQQLGLMSDAMGQLQTVAAASERAGDAARLSEVLRRMVDLDPDNIASSIKLGEIKARAGQPAAALECFRRAADYLKRNGRSDEYLKIAERIAVLTPDDHALARELAHLHLGKGDTKRALAKLQLCFKADARDVETLQLLAQAFRDLGQTSKTLSVYKELARVHEERGRAGDARPAWRKVLELAPDDRTAAALGAGAPRSATPSHPAAAAALVRAVPGSARVRAELEPPPMPGRAPSRRVRPGARVSSGSVILRPPWRRAGAPAGGRRRRDRKLLTETDVYVKYEAARQGARPPPQGARRSTLAARRRTSGRARSTPPPATWTRPLRPAFGPRARRRTRRARSCPGCGDPPGRAPAGAPRARVARGGRGAGGADGSSWCRSRARSW